jgi:hypothetical protein
MYDFWQRKLQNYGSQKEFAIELVKKYKKIQQEKVSRKTHKSSAEPEKPKTLSSHPPSIS